jgi:hypothetical protein
MVLPLTDEEQSPWISITSIIAIRCQCLWQKMPAATVHAVSTGNLPLDMLNG